MEQGQHELCDLFLQLGLSSDANAIEEFIKAHRPLPGTMLLSDAPFWNEGQRTLINQALKEDADWAPMVDQLNTRLR